MSARRRRRGLSCSPARRLYQVCQFIQTRGFVKTVCIMCLFAVLGIDPLLCRRGELATPKVPTNFEIIERISSEAVRDIIARDRNAAGRKAVVLLIKTKIGGNVDFMLENAFVKEMRNAGIRARDRDAGRRTIRAPRSGNTGSRTRSSGCRSPIRGFREKWWLGPKRGRASSARADIFAQFIDLSTGDIVWVREIHKDYGDTIDYSMLKLVEDPQYDFTRPSRSEFKMSRLFEPLVVGGIVVGLVYLFFSNQSND